MRTSVIRHQTMQEAWDLALEEAVCTMSAVVPIKGAEPCHSGIAVVAEVPIQHVYSMEEAKTGRTTMSATSVGNLHTCLNQHHGGPLGYLVMRPPFKIMKAEGHDDSDLINAAMECQKTIEGGSYGRYSNKNR